MPCVIDETVATNHIGRYAVAFYRDELVIPVSPEAGLKLSCLIPSLDFEALMTVSEPILSLGLMEHSAAATDVTASHRISLLQLTSIDSQRHKTMPLREFVAHADEEQVLIAGRAAQISRWVKQNKHCGLCGNATRLMSVERAFECEFCNHRFYPAISPCVIGTVIKGQDILLVHGHEHRPEIYSAVAGFVECGETAEQAFAREVLEETNITIQNIQYVSSQSWPFPGQMMLGFVAHYKSGSIHIDKKELVDAQWFNQSELPKLPPQYTISAQLIEHALTHLE